jgi:transposase
VGEPELVAMGFNFRECDRDQVFLMPPSVADWLEPDHLVWFLVDVVGQMDLEALYASYRRDGRGGAAFDPRMMVALWLYAYAIGETSSRKIEQRCRLDVAFRVLCANQQPDHTTISRFRRNNLVLLGQLFLESIRLCSEAGLGQVETVAIDGRKISANASKGRTRTRSGLERDIRKWLEDGIAVDAAEDAKYGVGKRGGEQPAELADPKSRRELIRRAKAALDAQDAEEQAKRDAKLAERAAYTERTGRIPRGRPMTGRTRRYEQKINLTDPDSRVLRRADGFIQGFNTQAVVSEDQIVVGAQVVTDANDQRQLTPMLRVAQQTLRDAGVQAGIRNVLADGGYGTDVELRDAEQQPDHPELFVATGHRRRDGTVTPDTPRGRMHEKLLTEHGQHHYAKRCYIIEPVFGQHLTVQRFSRFSLRGITAVNAEFKLVNAAHNLLKLWRHTNRTQATPQPA